jgi:hypothetical protein
MRAFFLTGSVDRRIGRSLIYTVITDGAKRRSQMRDCPSEIRASHSPGMTATGTSRYD